MRYLNLLQSNRLEAPESLSEISAAFQTDAQKVLFLAQAVEVSVRKSASPTRAGLLESLAKLLKAKSEDTTGEGSGKDRAGYRRMMEYVTFLVYTESVRDLFNPRVQEDDDFLLENEERLDSVVEEIAGF